MSNLLKKDAFDFYGNQMIVQLVRDDPDDPLKQTFSCSIKFYGKKFIVMPTWHPWFGPVFMSVDDYTLAGISPLIIPTPLALEYGNKATMLYMKEGFERIIAETEIEYVQEAPPVKNFDIGYSASVGRNNIYVSRKVDLSNYMVFGLIREPDIMNVSIDRYIPVNGIFYFYLSPTKKSTKSIYIPKDFIPSKMEPSARNVYNIIAQQHKNNYDKYVASIFRDIAKSGYTKLPWINTIYWLREYRHIFDSPPRAITVQTIEKTKYGITVGKEH